MSLAIGHAEFLLLPPTPRAIPSRRWKRRRLKPLTIQSHLNLTPSPFEHLFHSLLTQFPSTCALNYIAPTLGFASGLALYFSSNFTKQLSNPSSRNNSYSDAGEWILFTSPTPFNRFVILRCPSICFPELEDVNEKLVKEDRHYVKLSSGRMIERLDSDGEVGESMVYQRICVSTEDGGILSLDWPANLELEEERGLDTTVFIVPGTSEGSNEKRIRLFASECLRRGLFPVVMNPRGCAGSPLTTARLFTAADSDDISTAVQFINKKRPWTTLVGVAWGFGANMLTKYLAEFGERTPVTAATCIDNPFDLEEAARSSVHHMDFDQWHTNGLISILQRNKELFQGRGKRFDVEKAMSASSIRDFEESISMLSYGFDSIEDFYEQSSTRNMVGELKIPVLFIQSDGTVPLFSVPRGLIAANPYTSLLLCSYSPTNKVMGASCTSSWCCHLTLEWLTAVELGLLKGRHPLLKDLDFNINPSKGLALMESEASTKNGRTGRLLNGHSMNSPLNMLEADDGAVIMKSRSTQDKRQIPKARELEKEDDGISNQGISNQSSATIDAEILNEETNSPDDERGQVLASAQVVINMLDVTMPEILSDDQKKKVLSAVGQGETVMKALQDAVPEDVRGKLTSGISSILQSRGSDLKFDKLINLDRIPDMASGLNSKVLKDKQPKSNSDNIHVSDQKNTSNNSGDVSAEVDNSSDKPSDNVDSQNQSSNNIKKPNDTEMTDSTSNNGSNIPGVEKVNIGNSHENTVSDATDISEINGKNEFSRKPEGTGSTEDTTIDPKIVERDGLKGQLAQTENNNNKHDLSTDENKESEADHKEDQSLAPSPTSETQVTESETQSSEKEGKEPVPVENNKKEEKEPNSVQSSSEKEEKEPTSVQSSENEEKEPKSVPNQNSTAPPSFSVSQALDALTGFDDSTQVAVNSVFHAIEDMIDQLEVEKHKENKGNDETNKAERKGLDEVKEKRETSVSENHPTNNPPNSENFEGNSIKQSSDGTVLHDSASSEDKYENTENIISVMSAAAAAELSERNFAELLNSSSEKFPSYFPYDDPLYKEYLKRFISSKMRKAKPQDLDKTSALYLNYIPEEGQWKLLEEQAADDSVSINESSSPRSKHSDDIIEPSYVIMDSEKPPEKNEENTETHSMSENIECDLTKFDHSMPFIRSIVLERLNVEVGRRASSDNIGELELKLARDIDHVADAVYLAVEYRKLYMDKNGDDISDKPYMIGVESIIEAILSAYQETHYLKSVLPVGVVVGSTVAALRELCNVDANDEKHLTRDQVGKSPETVERILKETEDEDILSEDEDKLDGESSNNQVMVGAVTAALGASALFIHQQTTETDATSIELLNGKENGKESSKIEEMPDRAQNNIVTSLAEKAMSVASPVMPTKEDGGVDHERLVAMLADWGQRGGVLRLVGKLALLWGGICGAMSLTDKLISFLRISERPLYQRILGFVLLVLLLWSPVLVPLLPSLMQGWATHSPLKIVEFACIASLYISVIFLVTLWGKRIRNYDAPLQQYGLDLTSVPKFQNLLKGLAGGISLVILIHSVNSLLGCVNLSWPTTLASLSSEPVILMRSYGKMFLLIVQGIATATGIAIVEELLFRSWLPQEIEADLGYHRGIIISGLVFALIQRSIWEIPGLWLLSLSLAGARQLNQGSLSFPIGIRTGILASNFVLRMGGFLTYQPNYPVWMTGGHPLQPFSGVVGLAFSVLLAFILYPKQPLHRIKPNRAIIP